MFFLFPNWKWEVNWTSFLLSHDGLVSYALDVDGWTCWHCCIILIGAWASLVFLLRSWWRWSQEMIEGLSICYKQGFLFKIHLQISFRNRFNYLLKWNLNFDNYTRKVKIHFFIYYTKWESLELIVKFISTSLMMLVWLSSWI